MNGRKKKLYRSYGLNSLEAKEALAKIRKEFENMHVTPVHCSYMDYKITNESQKTIIHAAKRLMLVGKHSGSKPLGRLKKAVYNIQAKIDKYAKAYEAIQKLQELAKEAEQDKPIEENAD